MRLEESVRIEHPPERVFALVSDLAELADCVPGLQIGARRDDSSGRQPVFTGRWSVRFGPVSPTYSGTAQVLWADADAGVIGIRAHGIDESGHGGADALVETTVRAEGAGTRVDVRTDLSIRGRGAQFGHRVLAEISAAHVEAISQLIDTALAGAPPDVPAPASPVPPGRMHSATSTSDRDRARIAIGIAAGGAVALLGWLAARRRRT